jgi:hypothetical protein
MGASRPKRPLEEMLEEMAEAVNDAIHTESTEDKVLDILLELTIASIAENRPLYSSPLDEPLFYRQHFLPWVKEAMDEAAKLTEFFRKSQAA